MYFLYNLIVSIFFVLAFPYFLFRSFFTPLEKDAVPLDKLSNGTKSHSGSMSSSLMGFTPGYGRGLKEKLGFISQVKREVLNKRPNIWLHAVSVGEILASQPLIKLIQQKFPHYQLVISTTTSTGQAVARKRVSGAIFIYFPLDMFPLVSGVLNTVNPAIFIVAESEVWPNFFRVAHRRNIPIILFNGRISLRSYSRYRRATAFFRKVAAYISLFGMQTEMDARRIISLGADSSRVKVTGNTKFDALEKLGQGEIDKLRKELEISGRDLIFIAGSTHPGEEEIILNCFLKLKREFVDLRLILCPRHLERLAEVEGLISRMDISFSRRTHLPHNGSRKKADVILLDTMGELARVYSLAAVVFVGGSLIPKGGQNILEPINFGKPAVFGPYISNFHEIAELLENSGIGFRIQNKDELYQRIFSLLKDEKLREDIGDKAALLVARQRGASAKNFELIERYLLKIKYHPEKSKGFPGLSPRNLSKIPEGKSNIKITD